MLQPRSCRIACVLLFFLVTGLAEDPLQDEEFKDRVKRENGDVTVLSLEEIARLKDVPVGVLSSTARTFVTGGATTEYATQILGTTVGRTYARLLSTGSRVFYDNSKPSKESTPFLVFPTLPALINPSTVIELPATTKPVEPVETVTGQSILNEITDSNELITPPPKPVVSIRKEFSVKRNSDVKPAKVKPNSDLPTVTIKAEFAPSGYSDSLEERRDKKLRAGKGLFRGGVQIKNDFQKYDTVTYVGFADFTTTVGNTVIVFMPKTAAANNGPVTSIAGAATLRPEDAVNPVVTTVKTFLSHSSGMATKTVTGHTSPVQKTLPTVQAERSSKAYSPVYVTTEDSQETTENIYTTEKKFVFDEMLTTERATEFFTEGEPESPRKEQPTTEQHVTTEIEDFTTPEASEAPIPHEEVRATESLKMTPTFATTTTQVFIPGDKPLGLAKSISIVEAFDDTTTHLTSFLFGTVVDGEYTQLTQIVSSVSKPPSISPTPVLTDSGISTNVPEISIGVRASEAEENEDGETKPTTSIKLITKLVPATVHQTYTYLTTFFVPKGDTTTTSIKTREVVSDEIRYVATVIPENQDSTSSSLITPTTVAENLPTTTTLEPTTEGVTELTTPQLPDTTLSAATQDILTKADDISTTTEGTTIEPESIKPKTEDKEEEVEVIIRTLYTTYTYLTTFFQESATSVQSREVVETNVVTSTLDASAIPEATDPAVAGLFSPSRSEAVEFESLSAVVEKPPSEDTFLKTYTYYTTVFVDGETIIESKTEVVRETIQPTSTTTSQIYKTASSDENSVIPKEPLVNGVGENERRKKPSYGTISRQKVTDDLPTSEALVMPHPLQSSIDDAYSYDTTMSPMDRISATKVASDAEADESELLMAREEELKKEAMLAIGLATTTEEEELIETMVTDVTSSSSGGNKRKSFEEYESDPNDQISSESNTEEIEPSFSPTILLQTSYTTFTYFTTVYKGTTSDIISRLETVTNVVTETVKPTEIEPKLSPEEATLPITYFTTFTYWTTLYRGKNTMITSREETVSNVVTPTLDIDSSSVIEITDSPITPTSVVPSIIPTETRISTPATVSPIDIVSTPIEPSDPTDEESSTDVVLDPTTYYTTYTYFTTSYIGNETVINSHLETETNIETPTSSMSVDPTESILLSQVGKDDATPKLTSSSASLQPTGLISTIRTSEVNSGVTTLLNTDVYGTYIDGLYAQVLESSSEIVAPLQASSTTELVQPTGVVSINEGKIVDANGVTTTLFTTKAIGTYIDALYAQVLESTSSVIVDEVRKTELPENVESTTVVGSKVYTTGLVRLIEGSIINDHTTTYYESRVIGTLIDGRYAQIIESTSSFKADMSSTNDVGVSPTSTVPPASVISPTASVISASPAVVEGSQGTEDEDDDDNGKLRPGSKKKIFSPVIRPFSSRPRPTFQPKKKTGDPATTITRTSFTPTVTATPASKSSFGPSRNRFAANRSRLSTNQVEIRPTTSSSRRFSRPRSTSAQSFGSGSSSSSQSFGRGRSTNRVQPTATASTSARRGGFNYRASTGRPNGILPTSSRTRIRPTGAFNRFASTAPTEELNNNDISGAVVTEEIEHNTASDEEEEEAVTSSPTTTTESSRRANNPLLRFRRPPILQRSQSTSTTTSKPSTTPKRNPSLLRRPDSRAGLSITTTPRTRPTVNFNRNKPRPTNNLFPQRGLVRKQPEEPEEVEKDEQGSTEDEEEIEDNEYEGSETAEQTSSTTTEAPKNVRRSKALSPVVQIRPFTRRPRTRRQADYGSRSYSSRYRRPTSRVSYDYDYEDNTPEPVTREAPRQPSSRGYSSRSRGTVQARDYSRDSQGYSRDLQTHARDVQTQPPRVRPSPVASTPRHQFTLRERTSQQQTTTSRSSNFRRPTSSPRRRVSTELTTQAQRLSRPATRHRPVTTEAPNSYSRGTSRRYNQQTSRRTTARSRYRDGNDFDSFSAKPFDGTITVTHRIPSEVTIPVINGKNTEYKPVITAKPSLEVLAPYQYTNTIGKDGRSMIVLNSEITSTLPNGFMEVTKFLVFETPTTSVTFTPTTLRGRKTSFSHIVPSTVYEVRPEVSTIQPNLGDNPLANILLSQLLLGNLAQPTVVPGQPQTPVTEYKTKTTTYVTTVTSHTSTVLPLTFRGKEITTTIVDSSIQVITATEYLTETVVVTPTAVIQPALNNQLNTLLLPALLQAQLLNQQAPNPLKSPPQKAIDDLYNDRPLEEDNSEQRYNRQRDDELDDDRKVRESVEAKEQDVEHKPSRKKSKIKLREKDKGESSVITLYVSGKHPGEFTTLLSTVPVSESTGNLKKREIDPTSFDSEDFKIQASRTPDLTSLITEDISNYIFPSVDGIGIESSEVVLSTETEHGELGKYLDLTRSIYPSRAVEETSEDSTGHFLLLGHADSAPDQRKAPKRSVFSSSRVKRDTSLVRKVIRVKIPVRKNEQVGEDFYEPAASSQNEDISEGESEPTVTEKNEKKSRRVLVARRKPVEPTEARRRRVLVTKRRPLKEEDDDEGSFDSEEEITPVAPSAATRRRVLKTKKRLLTPDPEEIEASEVLPTKKLTVTRKRLILNSPSASQLEPSEEMRTLYKYQYSIPSNGADSSVMVSEIFMSGDKHSHLSPEMTSDADYKEIMEGMNLPSTNHHREEDETELTNDRETELSDPFISSEKLPATSDQIQAELPTTWKPRLELKRTERPTEKNEEEQDGIRDQGERSNENYPEPDSYGITEQPTTSAPQMQEEKLETPNQDYSEEEQLDDQNAESPVSPYTQEYEYDDAEEDEQVRDQQERARIQAERANDEQEDKGPAESEETAENQDREHQQESDEFELDSSYVTIFPYETLELDTSSTSSEPPTVESTPYLLSSHPANSQLASFPVAVDAPSPSSITSNETTSVKTSNIPKSIEPSNPVLSSEAPAEPTSSAPPTVTTAYQTLTKTLTSTRLRTYTYVVTRVSGDEQYVTSSTTVKPDIKTTTVTELVPVSSTSSATPSSISGRGLYVIEPRYNLATKVMANGVEVIVAGDKSTLPGAPLLKVIPTGLARPITLAPSTLTDHMMMVLPHESQKLQLDLVTKTYLTTYTYLTTFAEGDSTVVSSREKVVSNYVTGEVSPSRTDDQDHFTLASSPSLTTGIYHTTYTYLNTLVDGEQPLVVTSKKTVSNTKVEQPQSTPPMPQPQKTNTYTSKVEYSKTVNEGDQTKVVKTEDVLTQVVITESDLVPSSVANRYKPTPSTTDVTKTYFATYTYFNTKVVDGSTQIKTEVATSSDIVTETFTIQRKKSTSSGNDATKVAEDNTYTNSINLYATKTYLTTFTYFTTLLQDNKSPSTIIKSRTKVQQNIVTEVVDDGLIDPGYLNILKSSVNSKQEPVVATATLNNGNKMEITAVASKLVSPTQAVNLGSSFGEPPSNVITGSTIIFFDDDVQATPALESSIIEATNDNAAVTTETPLLRPTSAHLSRYTTSSKTKISSPEEGDESLLVELAADPPSSGGSIPVNNIFHGLNALGPVINAMADIFQNNFNGNNQRNESNIHYHLPQAFPYQRPINTGHKHSNNPAPIAPVYVPTYDSSDSEPAESQHLGGLNVLHDTRQRTKQPKPSSGGPSIEEALLHGGIPISPGQVITTNSDVIIGKHAVHGPRPPHNKPLGKNDLVEGMKPPPLPVQPQSTSSSSQLTSNVVPAKQQKPNTSPKPAWPPRDQERHPSISVPQRVAVLPPPNKSSPLRVPGLSTQDVPPLVPPPLRPQFGNHHKPSAKPYPHDHGAGGEQKYSLQIDPPKDSLAKPLKYYKNPSSPRFPSVPVSKETGVNVYEQRPPSRQDPYKTEKNKYLTSKPAVTINREDNANFDKGTHVNVSVLHQVNSIPPEPPSSPSSVDQTLLVNIQPSQVANVVIPHGQSTALIYSGASEVPSQKGEIFSEPSPYPDVEVGMVGVAGLSTSNGGATHVPSNAIRLDVPVSPQAVDIQSLKRPVPTEQKWNRPSQGKPPSVTRLEYMTPPPPPPTPQISSYVNFHLPKEQFEDQEGDYSVNNEYHASSEEIKAVPANHKSRPHWGSKPNSGLILPNTPTPFKPFSDISNNSGVQYSVINSKPVILGYDNSEKQPPIVKGKPGVTSFDNKDEATVSVGQPTHLAPADEMGIPTALSKQDTPSIATPLSFDLKREKPLQNKPLFKSRPSISKPVDNIKDAMSLDEKPPPPTYETPSYDIPTTMDSMPNSIGSAFGPERNIDGSVMGLTPPAVNLKTNSTDKTTRRPTVTENPTFRPAHTSRRPFPIRKRPPPPYKFEIPQSTVATKQKKPIYQETSRPTVSTIPSGVLSPPKSPEPFYPGSGGPQSPYAYRNNSQNYVSPVSINSVLGGSFKVEDLAQKPEVISADVKIPLAGNNVNSPHHLTPGSSVDNSFSETVANEGAKIKPPVDRVTQTFNRVRPPVTKEPIHKNRPGSEGSFGMKVPPQGAQSGSQPTQGLTVNYFTESESINNKMSIKDTNRIPIQIQNILPASTVQNTSTTTPASSHQPQNLDKIIVGSETVYPQDDVIRPTQPIQGHNPSGNYKQASTANLIKVTTGPSTHTYVTPVRNIERGHSVIPLQLKNRTSVWGKEGQQGLQDRYHMNNVPVSPTTYVVTHTQTMTVTTTESMIIQSKGQKPSTHTLVVTKTHTSTILDTVTEVRTLVKPTSIVQTVTTTIPQATTTIFPTSVQGYVEPTTIQYSIPSKTQHEDGDTILVVMSDKNSKNTLPALELDPNEPPLEIEAPPDEEEVSPNVLLGGLFANRTPNDNDCKPECKASRNERCQKINGVMRCVCRPGFARMFTERPCKPTYTFSMQVPLERVGWEKIRFSDQLTDPTSNVYQHLAEATKEGLDRMVMQSDLRDVYHGLSVTGFGKNTSHNDTMAKFYIQLSENTDQSKLEEVFKKHLKTNNYSMGGTELHAAKEKLDFLRADDFDECQDTKFNDCSENAQCFNLKGTYTCSCKEGFTDLSHNTLFPGRICSAEMIGCERCNFHGNCFPRESEEDLCECFQWYAGQFCQINLKVLLLILSLVGISLVVLLVVCLVLSCMKRHPLRGRGMTASQLRPPGFRIRPHQPQDKRAMISLDTSSEASMEHTPPPYVKQAGSLQSQMARPQKPCRKQSKAPSPPLSYHGTMEQRDRSLTVMIPRAKYRPVPVQGSNLTMSTFGPEQKLLKYLTVEKSQNSKSSSRKPSDSTMQSQEASVPKKLSHAQAPLPRKPSTGALVSAGFEVSATVGRTKEIHECFISEPHTDLNQGGFSTIRTADSSVFVDVPPPPTLEAELLDSSQIAYLTVSEARSYDETLIHPPTKCLRSNIYDRNGSEGHTMVERDTGSTFVMPQSQLYRPDRGNGSDISNFDSL